MRAWNTHGFKVPLARMHGDLLRHRHSRDAVNLVPTRIRPVVGDLCHFRADPAHRAVCDVIGVSTYAKDKVIVPWEQVKRRLSTEKATTARNHYDRQ